MSIYILRRFLQMIPVVLGVTVVVFLIMQLVPGDPARLLAGEGATPEQVEAIRASLGLNKPLIQQYLDYLSHVLQGDLGKSMVTNSPVLDEILIRLPTTVELAIASIFVAVTLGLTAGIISATKQNSFSDLSIMVVALLGVSMPSFWIGLMLMYYFSVELGLFPVAGWGTFSHMVLPALTLGSGGAAIIARMTRASMLEVIRQDYIRTARAKGLSENKIIFKHALKNALIPIITVVGLQFGTLLGGTVLTESVFAINGVGQLVINAIRTRDLPMVQGIVLMVSVIFMFVNMGVDILYRAVNKRVELD